ncbi:hypothetical protein, partial [Acidocella aminolytica]
GASLRASPFLAASAASVPRPDGPEIYAKDEAAGWPVYSCRISAAGSFRASSRARAGSAV